MIYHYEHTCEQNEWIYVMGFHSMEPIPSKVCFLCQEKYTIVEVWDNKIYFSGFFDPNAFGE